MIHVRFKQSLYFVLIIFSIVNTAWPISQDSKTNAVAPQTLSGDRESPGALATADLGSATTTTTSRVSIEPPRGDSDGGPSLQTTQKIVTISSANDAIKVVKVITPLANKTGRRMGEFARVGVEIHSIVDKEIKISLREIIDENLNIFKSTEHGYILSNEDQICYYRLGFLDDLESGKLIATPTGGKNGGKLLTFKGNCTINVRESKISGYAFREPFLLIWPPETNGSLKNISYIGLRDFLENKLALDNSRIDNLTINCTPDSNASIKYNDDDLARIYNNETCLGDKCPVLVWNNISHHLEFKEINKKLLVYDTFNILAFDDVVLEPYSTFVYWYHVMPSNHGIYDTETLVTLKEAKNRAISSHLELEILEDNPQFDVHREFNRNQIYKNDQLDFEFDVDYRGGGAEPVINNIPVRFDPSNYYEYIRIDGKDISMGGKNKLAGNQSWEIFKNFTKDKTLPIVVTVKFNNTGILSPPSIWINNRYVIFDETAANVTVDIPFWRYFSLINLLLVAISSIAIFLAKELYLETGGRRDALMKKINVFRESPFGIIIIFTLLLCLCLICIFLVRWLIKV
jgi:hypothetical protein